MVVSVVLWDERSTVWCRYERREAWGWGGGGVLRSALAARTRESWALRRILVRHDLSIGSVVQAVGLVATADWGAALGLVGRQLGWCRGMLQRCR